MATVAVDTVVNNKADTEVDSVAQLVAVVDRPASKHSLFFSCWKMRALEFVVEVLSLSKQMTRAPI